MEITDKAIIQRLKAYRGESQFKKAAMNLLVKMEKSETDEF